MLTENINGPALVKLGQHAMSVVTEFYVVFWRGKLQPAQYESYAGAQAAWRRLEDIYEAAVGEKLQEVA